jgi:hypothetical protein
MDNRKEGIKVLRITNEDVITGFTEVIAIIKTTLVQQFPPGTPLQGAGVNIQKKQH